MKFILPIVGMRRKKVHKKTAYDGNRRQLDRTILENTLLVNGTRKGGK